MTKKGKRIPYLLSICIWGVFIIQLIIIAGAFLLMFNLSSFNELQSFFATDDSFIVTNGFLNLVIIFFLIFIYSSIQILRRKIHAVYIFHLLSFFLIAFLIYNSPTEWVNVLMIILVNYFIFINLSWFKEQDNHTNPDEDAVVSDDEIRND